MPYKAVIYENNSVKKGRGNAGIHKKQKNQEPKAISLT